MSAALDSPWRRVRFTRLRDLIRGQINGSLDWRRTIDASALPVELRETVQNVVRRTRLWRSERVAVAKELVAHFQDGIETGQTVAALRESFGDVAATAKLIRRAKKRGRPWVWHAWRWSVWGLLALIVAYAMLWFRAWWSTPTVTVDYLTQLNRRALAVPADQAAWPEYLKALDALGYREERPPADVDWTFLPARAATDAAFARFARQHGDEIAKLRDAANRPGLGASLQDFVSEGPTGQFLFSRIRLRHVEVCRAVHLVLTSHARWAAASGDVDAATKDLIAILNMGNQLNEQPFLVSGLIVLAINSSAYSEIERLVRRRGSDLSDAQLQRLAHAVAGVRLDYRWWLEGERLAFRDLVQRIYSDDGAGDGHITVEGLQCLKNLLAPLRAEVGVDVDLSELPMSHSNHWWNSLATSLDAPTLTAPALMASRSEVTALYERIVDEAVADHERPLWERANLSEGDPDEQWTSAQRLRFYPITLMLPAFGVERRMVEAHEGVREGVMVGLALELYVRENGELPAQLDELAPRYLPQLPIDRINGKPLQMRLIDGAPVVYSVGADRDDDGGRAPSGENGDWYASPGGVWGNAAAYDESDGDWVLWRGPKIATAAE